MAIAFKPALVINTVWLLAGGIPSDHVIEPSQGPLVELVHRLGCVGPVGDVVGITSPVGRIVARQIPSGNPAGSTNTISSSWRNVNPDPLLPKMSWSAPPPEIDPFQLEMVSTPIRIGRCYRQMLACRYRKIESCHSNSRPTAARPNAASSYSVAECLLAFQARLNC